MPEPEAEAVESLQQALQVDEAVARLLVQRGITTFGEARWFFRPAVEQLHDPFLMRDMRAAVDRILRALRAGERILIYGDYDVDGTSSVALLDGYLRTHTDHSCIYIPDRYAEGYGISLKGIDYAVHNEIDLIIALDCGTKAIEQIAYARSKGIDVIVCDHHRPGATLPEAVAVLNPKRPDCPYPYKELCGCGVGFKLVTALARSLGQSFEEIREHLDLVALAIAADIVPMDGENRTLAALGLAHINRRPRPGLEHILPERYRGNWTVEHLVFQAAPRINAAGRMGHATRAVYLLQAESEEEADKYARAVESWNEDRKGSQEEIFREALRQISESGQQDKLSTVVYAPHWHKGVIGIVASKLIEQYHRPTVVLCGEGDVIVGSARSIPGFDLYQALDACAEFMTKFGGHTFAAGMSVRKGQLQEFRAAFERQVAERLGSEPRVPELNYDGIMSLGEITPRFYRILKQFAPFGPSNPRPVFRFDGLLDNGYTRKVGGDKSHLKFGLKDDKGHQVSGIGFGMAEKSEFVIGGRVDVLAALDENHWNGNTRIELSVQDVAPSGSRSSVSSLPSKTAKVQ